MSNLRLRFHLVLLSILSVSTVCMWGIKFLARLGIGQIVQTFFSIRMVNSSDRDVCSCVNNCVFKEDSLEAVPKRPTYGKGESFHGII